jgi:site-specific recombinase XerD
LANILERHPQTNGSAFMFPSPTGNHEQNMLRLCKDVAERAGLDPTGFDLKTFRSIYATRMLRQGFDIRTVQDWMGHKSLETTMRYLVPATDCMIVWMRGGAQNLRFPRKRRAVNAYSWPHSKRCGDRPFPQKH